MFRSLALDVSSCVHCAKGCTWSRENRNNLQSDVRINAKRRSYARLVTKDMEMVCWFNTSACLVLDALAMPHGYLCLLFFLQTP